MFLGLLQALAISFEYLTKNKKQAIFSRMPAFFARWTNRLITYIFYAMTLVFFFSPDLEASFYFFKKISSLNFSSPIFPELISREWIILNYVNIISYFVAFGLMVLFLTHEMISIDMIRLHEKLNVLWNNNKMTSRTLRFCLYYTGILLLFYFGEMQTEFVYFQF